MTAFSVDSLEVRVSQSEASVHFLDNTLSTENISENSGDSLFGQDISSPKLEIGIEKANSTTSTLEQERGIFTQRYQVISENSSNGQISQNISNLKFSKLAKTNRNGKLAICGIVILLIVSILCVIGAKVGQLETRINGVINETKLAKLENDREMYKINYRWHLTQTDLEGIQNWLENTILPKT